MFRNRHTNNSCAVSYYGHRLNCIILLLLYIYIYILYIYISSIPDHFKVLLNTLVRLMFNTGQYMPTI